MRRNNGFIFLAGALLALTAFVTLAPIIPPPGATGSTGPQGSPGISGSPGPQGSPGPNTIAATTAVLKGDNAGGAVAATANTDYSNPAGVQALIDAKFGTASVAISGGTTATISHGFGLCASGMSAVYQTTGEYIITKSTPFTPTGDSRDYAVTVTLAEPGQPLFAMAQKTDDSNILIRVLDVALAPADPTAPFAISIQSLAPPP